MARLNSFLAVTLLLGNVPFIVHAQQKPLRMLIIHSYSRDYSWTADEDKGIVKAFSDTFDKIVPFKVERIYLDEKKTASLSLPTVVESIKSNILKDIPNGVILTDDFAVGAFSKFLLEHKVPVSFSGLSGDLKRYELDPPPGGITGTMERYSLEPVLPLVFRSKPTLSRVLVVSDDSTTGRVLAERFTMQAKRAVEGLKYELPVAEFVDHDADRLKHMLKAVDPNTTLVLFAALDAYRDTHGRVVSYSEWKVWLDQNTKFPDFGKPDRLFSVETSGLENGYFAGRALALAVQYADRPMIPIRQFTPLRLVLNKAKAKKLNFHFSKELVDFAEMTKMAVKESH